MVLKTEAISNFLVQSSHPDLAALYSHDMECQVNAAEDGGERVTGEYNGRQWQGWSDGRTTWKSFRIPWSANKDPTFTDSDMRWALDDHCDGIGMTGWDWKHKVSKWVAYDFDAVVGHSSQHQKKMTSDELDAVRDAASAIPWVTTRYSTSGSGLHLYVFLDDVPTQTHTEHAALARAILGLMSALTGFDFESGVDVCGGNMWVWHRKMRGNGLKIIKEGGVLPEVPANWRDHMKVIAGTRRRNLPQDIEGTAAEDPFERISTQRPKIQLDSEHRAIIEWLRENDAFWWWDQDNNMLVTHTGWLKKAHEALKLRGFFDTMSDCSNMNEQNCFAFPIRQGGFSVRRYTMGCAEHRYWKQDSRGWTYAYFNKDPDLHDAANACGGIEDTDGGYVFREGKDAVEAAKLLGTHIEVSNKLQYAKANLKTHKDGRLVVVFDKPEDVSTQDAVGFLEKKGKLQRIVNANTQVSQENESETYDDLVRHAVTEDGTDAGWFIYAENFWNEEPIGNVDKALKSIGFAQKDTTQILGSSVFRPWRMVNKPFEDEYPGNRQWNRDAARLKVSPTRDADRLDYTHWNKILRHLGENLNEHVKKNPWCIKNGIETGADYLFAWVASLFQCPDQPLPYLFFYSNEQDTGKSILWESLERLFANGCQRAESALCSTAGFNGELLGTVLAVVEELDLSTNKHAYNRIKDWVTARKISIHPKGATPYLATNTTHWIQCANDPSYCPVFRGDTRITMIKVNPLDPLEMIPKRILEPILDKEAGDFLAAIMAYELPEPDSRLNVPVIETEAKASNQLANASVLRQFMVDQTETSNGSSMAISEFYDHFTSWMVAEGHELADWTKQKVSKEVMKEYPKGRYIGNQFHYGNIRIKTDAPHPKNERLLLVDGKLEMRNVT